MKIRNTFIIIFIQIILIVNINTTATTVLDNCYDTANCAKTKCSENCMKCESATSCRACNYGYFLYKTPQLTDECLPCPYQDLWAQPYVTGKILKCADCIQNSISWSGTRICKKSYLSVNVDYLRVIQDLTDYQETYQLVYDATVTSPGKTQYKIEIVPGCRVSKQEFNELSEDETKVLGLARCLECNRGNYFKNGVDTQCFPCDPNCSSCVTQPGTDLQQCKRCNSGYALKNDRTCVRCSDVIVNCSNCYYGTIDTNYSESIELLDGVSIGSITDYNLRCIQCQSDRVTYRVPFLDLQTCYECKTYTVGGASKTTNCYRCEFLRISDLNDDLTKQNPFSHSQNPSVVSSADLTLFIPYCLDCVPGFFITQNAITCAACQTDCIQCYFVRSHLQAVPVGIADLDGTPICKRCSPNKFLSSDYSTCNAFAGGATPLANCIQQVATSSPRCQICNTGYYLNPTDGTCTTTCLAQKLNDPFCDSCFFRGIVICQRCLTGYYPTPNGCQPCLNGCKECFDRSLVFYYTNEFLFDSTLVISVNDMAVYQQKMELYDNPYCKQCGFPTSDLTKKGLIEPQFGQCALCDEFCDVCDDDLTAQTKRCSTCVELTTPQGPYFSIFNQRTCKLCPLKCRNCLDRTQEDILRVNSFFDMESKYVQYSKTCNVCLPNTADLNYFLHPVFNRCYSCPKAVAACQNTYQQTYILDCQSAADSLGKYSLKKIINSKKPQKEFRFTLQETSENFKIFNEDIVEEIQLRLQVEPGKVCLFQGDVSFTTLFPKKIFAINKLSLIFQSSDTSGKLARPIFRFESNFTIEYFDTISFFNINFEAGQGLKNTYIFGINTINTLWPVTLTIQNSIVGNNLQLLNDDQRKKDFFVAFFMITLIDARSITLINLDFNDLKIKDFSPINLQYLPTSIDSYADKLSLTIQNLSFNRVQINNVNFFPLYLLQTNIQALNISITSSILKNSQFFVDYPSSSTRPKLSVSFDELNLIDSQFEDFQFTNIKNAEETKASQWKIKGASEIYLNSEAFFVFNTLSLNTLEIDSDVVIKNATLISTPISSKSVLSEKNLLFQFKNINITGLQCINNVDCFIRLGKINQTGENLVSAVLTNITFSKFQFSYQPELNLSLLTNYNLYDTKVKLFSLSYLKNLDIKDFQCIDNEQFMIFSISDVHKVTLVNSQFKFNQSVNHNFLDSNKLSGYLMRIDNIRTSLLISNITIKNVTVVNKPLIHIIPVGQVNQASPVAITIEKGVFTDNFMLLREGTGNSSIIFIKPLDAPTHIQITDSIFTRSYLIKDTNEFLIYESAACIHTEDSMGLLLIKNITFSETTSLHTKTNIMARANIIEVINSTFINSNRFVRAVDDDTTGAGWYFRGVSTSGGHAYFRSRLLQISSSIFYNSYAQIGGAIYYKADAAGVFRLEDSLVQQSTTTMNATSISLGGGIYIDATSSSLDMQVLNCQFIQTTARYEGGAIYVRSGRETYKITLKNNFFYYNLAMAGSFLSGRFSTMADVKMENNRFVVTLSEYTNFLKNIFFYPSDMVNNPEQLSDPSYIVLESATLALYQNSFQNLCFMQILQVVQSLTVSDSFSNYTNLYHYNSPMFEFSNVQNLTFSDVIFSKSQNVEVQKLQGFGVKSNGFFEVDGSSVTLVNIIGQQLNCSLCRQSVFYMINSPINITNSLFIENVGTIGGIFNIEKSDERSPPSSFSSENLNLSNSSNATKRMLNQNSVSRKVLQSDSSDTLIPIEITNTQFIRNRALEKAGAISVQKCSVKITDTLFSNNSAFRTAGALLFINSSVTYQNASIIFNEAQFVGATKYINSVREGTTDKTSQFNKAYVDFDTDNDYCIYGESKIGDSCQNCPIDYYNLLRNNTGQCKMCQNDQSTCYFGFQIDVHPGYWRLHNYSDIIVHCQNEPINCLGGKANQTCLNGHIGALCQSCDIFAEKWGESWGFSYLPYKCDTCSDVTHSAVWVALVSGYTLFISTLVLIDGFYTHQYYELHYFLSKKGWGDNSKLGPFMKILIHWQQILLVVSAYYIDLPRFIRDYHDKTGTPGKEFIVSIDCFLAQYRQDIPLPYLRILFFVAAFVGFFLVLATFAIAILQKVTPPPLQLVPPKQKGTEDNSPKQQIDPQQDPIILKMLAAKAAQMQPYGSLVIQRPLINHLATMCIFICIYFQPGFFQELVKVLRCREIGGLWYIHSNPAVECYTDDYKVYSAALIFPLLLLFGVMLPALTFLSLQSIKLKGLFKSLNFLLLHVLFQQYKVSHWYWEILKMFLQMAVYMVLALFTHQISVQGFLVFLIVFVYYIILVRADPYSDPRINRVEQWTTEVILISLVSGLLIEGYDYQWIKIIGYIILYTVNIIFLLNLLLNIFHGKIRENQQKLDSIRSQFITQYEPVVIQVSQEEEEFEKEKQEKAQKEIVFQKGRKQYRIKPKQVKNDQNQKDGDDDDQEIEIQNEAHKTNHDQQKQPQNDAEKNGEHIEGQNHHGPQSHPHHLEKKIISQYDKIDHIIILQQVVRKQTAAEIAQLRDSAPILTLLGISQVSAQRRKFLVQWWQDIVYYWRIRKTVEQNISVNRAATELVELKNEEIKLENELIDKAGIKQTYHQGEEIPLGMIAAQAATIQTRDEHEEEQVRKFLVVTKKDLFQYDDPRWEERKQINQLADLNNARYQKQVEDDLKNFIPPFRTVECQNENGWRWERNFDADVFMENLRKYKETQLDSQRNGDQYIQLNSKGDEEKEIQIQYKKKGSSTPTPDLKSPGKEDDENKRLFK